MVDMSKIVMELLIRRAKELSSNHFSNINIIDTKNMPCTIIEEVEPEHNLIATQSLLL